MKSDSDSSSIGAYAEVDVLWANREDVSSRFAGKSLPAFFKNLHVEEAENLLMGIQG